MTGSGERRRTRLVEDTPANEDAFAGAHQRVADAITELIKSNDEVGGKTIGLEGRWGSGKSTILRMVCQALEFEPPKQRTRVVIVFDAWAHDGDPLRRTFLETLISSLEAADFVDKKRWNAKLLVLAKKRRREKTRSHQRLRLLGVCFAISAIAVPFGAAVVSGAIDRGETLALGAGEISWNLVVGSTLALLPLVVVSVNLLRLAGRFFWKGIGPRSSDWDLIQQSGTATITTSSTATPDPTSREFERFFDQVMEEALAADSKRRIVLVVDNLDRVEPQTALQLWSAMQTFLQDHGGREPRWFQQLWTIVPFDPDALSRIWGAQSIDGLEGAGSTALAFIDKTFPVRFLVPPPMLSNWRVFLLKLLHEALPDHDERDLERVYAVYAFCRLPRQPEPTPRELKVFVNSIGSVHRQWQETFRLDHIAYFVIQARLSGISRLHEKLLHKEQPARAAIGLLGEDLIDSLAALLFNVEPKLGRELLLRDSILSDLQMGNRDDLAKLATHHVDRFWNVFDGVVRSGVGNNAHSLVNSAYCLADERLAVAKDRPSFLDMKGVMAVDAIQVDRWDLNDQVIATRLPGLLRFMNAGSVARQVAQRLMLGGPARFAEPQGPSQLVEVVFDLLEAAADTEGWQPDRIPMPLSATEWLAVCPTIRKRDPSGEYWEVMAPAADSEQIGAALDLLLSSGKASQPQCLDSILVSSRAVNVDWAKTVATIEQRLAAFSDVEAKEFDALWACLEAIRTIRSPALEPSLRNFSTAGVLLHYLYARRKAPPLDLLAQILASNPSLKKPLAHGQSDAGYRRLIELLERSDDKLASSLVSTLRKRGDIEVLLAIVEVQGVPYQLVQAAWRFAARESFAFELFTGDEVVSRWRQLRLALGDAFDLFVRRAVVESSLCDVLTGSSIDLAKPGEVCVAVVATRLAPPAFLTWAAEALASLSRDQWQQVLTRRLPALDVLQELREQGHGPTLSFDFRDALVEHAEGVRAGKVPVDDTWSHSRWAGVLNALDTSRTSFRRELARAIERSGGKLGRPFLIAYGDELKAAVLEAPASERGRIITEVFEPVLKEMDEGSLRWLEGVLATEPSYLASVLPSVASDFRRRLSEQLQGETGESAHQLLDSISRHLGVE